MQFEKNFKYVVLSDCRVFKIGMFAKEKHLNLELAPDRRTKFIVWL